MDELISDIISYIKYLREIMHLNVSVHLNKKYSLLCYIKGAGELIAYSSHTTPYCLKIKSDERMRKKCLKCQQFTRIKLKNTASFTGICHADVTEYVRAVRHNGEVMGFVSTGGYKSDTNRIKKDENLLALYDCSTVPSPPPTELFDRIIPPLCRMLELLPEYAKKETENEILAQNSDFYRLRFYLDKNYTDVKLSDLCREFNKSASAISHMFKKMSGYTINRYCNILKINDAKNLLRTTHLSVSQIAEATGFNDFSYFIKVFKYVTGLSPLVWRKKQENCSFEENRQI